MKQKFIDFLIKNNVLEAFCVNLSLGTWHKGKTLSQYIKLVDPTDLIYSAFYWDDTTEKEASWQKLSKTWKETIN